LTSHEQWRRKLKEDFDVNLWKRLGKPGSTVTDTLTRATRTNEFAIIILTGDDVTLSRAVSAQRRATT
jgi:predicted nucleotide-binding protein